MMAHSEFFRIWVVSLVTLLVGAADEVSAEPLKLWREVADARRGEVVGHVRAGRALWAVAPVERDGVLLSSPATDGLAWLKANQNASGSWGATYEFVDTCTAIGTLAEADPNCVELGDGAAWLSGQTAGNYEYLGREIVALRSGPIAAGLAEDLLAVRNPAEWDTALPNWPEGGWGVASGYETDCLTTALAMLALNVTGFNGGFAVTDEPLAAGATNIHEWEIPADAIKVRMLITVTGSEIRLCMREGGPGGPCTSWFPVLGGPFLITFPDSGLPFTPGTNFVRIESTGPAATYSLTASYETPTFDTRMLAEPLAYLREAQNVDGGWGVQRGTDTEFYTTLHVLLALLAYSDYDFAAELADGIAYVQLQQLGDGSFGYGGTPVSYVTALAALTLVRSETYPFSLVTEDSIDALLAMQDVDGSWDQEPYDTALGVLALWDHNQTPSVDAGPDQSIEGTGPVCGEEVALSGSASDVDGVIERYVWSIEGLEIATGPVAAVVLPVGEHAITLTVTDDLGKSASDTVSVVVLYGTSLVSPWPLGDSDCSGAIDLYDYAVFPDCMTGPAAVALPAGCTYASFDSLDFDADVDTDLHDFARFQLVFGEALPTGACCLSDGSCSDVAGEAVCAASGGVYQGTGTDCASVDCLEPQACCHVDGSCQDKLVDDCTDEGGSPQGADTTCAGTTCEPATEACCFTDGSCVDDISDDCVTDGGTPQGDDTTCASTECPFGRYSNEIGSISGFFAPGTNVAVGDDMGLAGSGARKLVYYDLMVYGGGGGVFDVTASLYTDCPGDGGSLIPGTAFTWSGIPDDGYLYTLQAFPASVAIPDTVWMVVTFSTNYAGWIIAEEAEIGFTADLFGIDQPPWGCNFAFAPPPDPPPYGGFWANLRCVEAR